MTFYKSIPVVVEAHRFDGSEGNAARITEWLVTHGVKNTMFYKHTPPYTAPDHTYKTAGYAAQFDLGIPHVKIADVSDYIVRVPDGLTSRFRVFTEDQFKATYESACSTCSGRVRETTNLVCQTCGHDYSKGL